MRDRGFNVLHLDRHGGIIGAHNFFLSRVINFLAQSFVGKLHSENCSNGALRKLAVGVSKLSHIWEIEV